MEDKERFASSREFVLFINKFTEVIELQLAGVRSMIEQSVDHVMKGINDISTEIGERAQVADRALEQTYYDPDHKTQELVTSIQDSVDAVIENARAHLHEDSVDELAPSSSLLDNKLRRFGGQFSKYMEALSNIDKEAGMILYSMISALSNDDVIRQRLEHILMSVHGLQIGLSYVLIDFNSRFNLKEVDLLKKDLLAYTYKLYTSESEKEAFRDIFGSPPETDECGITKKKK